MGVAFALGTDRLKCGQIARPNRAESRSCIRLAASWLHKRLKTVEGILGLCAEDAKDVRERAAKPKKQINN
jgi:hypothetical protein